MKINIINDNSRHSNLSDVLMLRNNLFRHFKNRVSIEYPNVYENKIQPSDINIFVNIPNYTYLKYAPVNILLITLSKFKKVWKYYLKDFDYIITKCSYDYNILQNSNFYDKDKTKLINLDWKAKDNYLNNVNKTNEWLYINNNNNTDNPFLEKIINIWSNNPDFPLLNILNTNPKYMCNSSTMNIRNIKEFLKDDKLLEIQNRCKFHLNLHNNLSFSHGLNESLSCKSIVIAIKELFNNINSKFYGIDLDDNSLINGSIKKSSGKFIGSNYNIDSNILEKEIKRIIKYINANNDNIESYQNEVRRYYLKNSTKFNEEFEKIFREIFSCSQKAINNFSKIIKDKELEIEKIYKNLPKISLITPTYNRSHFLKLMIWNYNNMSYPLDKIEWIIVDDSDIESRTLDNIDDFNKIIDNDTKNNIKYIRLKDRKYSIGEKRNIGVKNASNDIICMMDDDDYYPYNSIRYRVIEMLLSGKKCCGITSFGCFHINKLVSIFKVNDISLSLGERISPASLCFFKSFWNDNKDINNIFNEKMPVISEKNTNEAYKFIKGRESDIHEVFGSGVLVSLLHNKNYKHNNINFKISSTPNGCHFGWSDELYLMTTNLDIEYE